MTTHSNFNGIGNSDLLLENHDDNPEIQEEILQAVAFLMGFHTATRRFKWLQTDVDGRLLVSFADVEVPVLSIIRPDIDNTADRILAANPSRRSVTIQNLGGSVLYIGGANTVTPANGFPVGVGATYNDDIYTGELWGIVAAGIASLAVIEV